MADPIICSPIISVHFFFFCLRSSSSKVLIQTLVGTDKSRGFDTQLQLPMMHLPPCKCQDVAAERLPPHTAGTITLPVPNLCVREVEGCEGRFSHPSHKPSPKSTSPGTAKLIGKPGFCFSPEGSNICLRTARAGLVYNSPSLTSRTFASVW